MEFNIPTFLEIKILLTRPYFILLWPKMKSGWCKYMHKVKQDVSSHNVKTWHPGMYHQPSRPLIIILNNALLSYSWMCQIILWSVRGRELLFIFLLYHSTNSYEFWLDRSKRKKRRMTDHHSLILHV